ncbi:MAG: 50S ribosomal protein L25 [Myxococcota bacterium]|nr:50S ribosomal protein L25 [Myxococcota bacterium]
MAEESIALEIRSGLGKSHNRKLREAGMAPGVVYGGGKDPVSVAFDPLLLEKKIKASHSGINTLFDLEGDASVANRTVMVKEIQREPVRRTVLHADFLEIDLALRVQVSVPIHLLGDAPGLVEGGVVEHALRELELSCLPGGIPDDVTLDISGLELGDSLHVSDITLPGGVELISDSALSVVSMLVPRAVQAEEAAPVEGEEAAEGEAAEEAAEGSEAKED